MSRDLPASPQVNKSAIRNHLKFLQGHLLNISGDHGPGKIIMASYGQDPISGSKLKPIVKHCLIPELINQTGNISKLSNSEHRNVYMPLSLMSTELQTGKKGGEDDILTIFGVVADFDDDNADKWKERIPCDPTWVLETSSGRFQVGYLFSRPIQPEQAKIIAIKLRKYCNCDYGTADISHVWRIPGTLNWPNQKKVMTDKRDPSPQLTTPIGQYRPPINPDKLLNSISFTAQCTPTRRCTELQIKGIRPEILEIINDGVDIGERSEKLYSVIINLLLAGYQPTDIARILEKTPDGIGQKYHEKGKEREQWLAPQVEKAYANLDNGDKTLIEFLRRFAFLVDEDKVVDLQCPPKEPAMKWVSFDRAFKNKRTIKKGVPAITTVWLHHPNRKTFKSECYLPSCDRTPEVDGQVRHNVFQLPPWKPTQKTDLLGPFIGHIKFLFPDLKRQKFFLEWLAFTVSKDKIATRSNIVPLLIATEHGMGRDWLDKVIRALLGEWNCSKTKMKPLSGESNDGQYHNYLYRTLYCYVGETRTEGKRYEVNDEIRDKLIDSPMNLNLKYGGNITSTVYTNFLLASNHRDALAIPPEDRRLWVHETPGKPKPQKYYDTLYKWLNNKDALAQLFWWCQRRVEKGSQHDLLARAPKTWEKEAMISTTISSLEATLRGIIDQHIHPVITESTIVKLLDNKGEMDTTDLRQTRAILRQIAHPYDSQKRIRINGKREYVWVIEDPQIWLNSDRAVVRKKLEDPLLSSVQCPELLKVLS